MKKTSIYTDPSALDGVPMADDLNANNWAQTDNVLIAVALMTIGCRWDCDRIIDVEGGNKSGERLVFRFAPITRIKKPDGSVIVHAAQHLISMLRDGTLEKQDPEHPVLYCLQSLLNYQKVMNLVWEKKALYSFKRPDSNMTALIHEGHEQAVDTLARLFRRSGNLAGKKNPMQGKKKPRRRS